MVGLGHWLDELENVFHLLTVDGNEKPLTFLIDSEASLSSGGPTTDSLASALMLVRPGVFASRAAVYAGSHEFEAAEWKAIVDEFLSDLVPHIGYRCIAALARTRPVVIVNLNWDNCVVEACARLGLPGDHFIALDLEDTEAVAAETEALLSRGCGLLSVHVNGRIDDPDGRMPRFTSKEWLSCTAQEFELLQRLLNFRTFAIGTSLSSVGGRGPLMEAMLPPDGTPENQVEQMWVVERGRLARMPDPVTAAGNKLGKALDRRRSTANFFAAPDVDFDLFVTTLRAAEVGYTWADVTEASDAPLPSRSELVPPNPSVVRPLLDGPGILVGRSSLGKLSVAHQVGHWLSILGDEPTPLQNVRGGEAVVDALGRRRSIGSHQVLIGDNFFGSDTYRPCDELAAAVEAIGESPGVILTSRPAPWFMALADRPAIGDLLRVIPFQASQVWTERALKGYVRRLALLGGPNLEEAIERGEVTTPNEVDQVADGRRLPPHSEAEQLGRFLGKLRRNEEKQALALALIRLQDMNHAVPRSRLREATGADLDELLKSPWELVASIQIDDEYLCFARREAVAAVDHWMEIVRTWLGQQIASLGERERWAQDALARWEQLRDLRSGRKSIAEMDRETIELLGPELIEPALGVSPKEAMAVLQSMFEAAQDSWAMREVAFELVRRWDVLRRCPKAEELRDQMLEDAERRGMYGLFEGLLRQGGTGQIDLWNPVVTRLMRMLGRLDEDGNRRQVALVFDALLWRPAPVDAQQNRELLERIIEAAEGDPLLWAACAAAAAYHWEGTKCLVEFDLPNPVEDLGNVSEAQAIEMAWIVEWHLVHQSRNRALVSRRHFRSTRTTTARDQQPRLLSRKPIDRPLGAEAAVAVQRVVAQMGRFKATAGWALHMIVNIYSTAGHFTVRKLPTIVEQADPGDPGVIWAAITYEPNRRLGEELRGLLKSDKGKGDLQGALAGEMRLDGTAIRAPRFVATLDPWWEVRRRMRMNADLFDDLGLPEAQPWKLVEVAREVRVEVIGKGAREDLVDTVIDRLAMGDTRLIDSVHSEEGFSERGRKTPKEGVDLRGRVESLLFVAATLMAMEEGEP